MRFLPMLLLVAVGTCHGQASPDPVALFKRAAAAIEQADAFSVHLEKTFDVILVDGVKVQYSGAADIIFSRDDGLFIDYGDDLSAKAVWFDGETVTILDRLANIYVAVDFAGTVQQVISGIEREYGVEMPLSGLLKQDLSDGIEDAVVASRHLGLHDVEGSACHHLLFRGDESDWQVWIEDGEAGHICKLVVTFTDIESSPQQTVVFSGWDFEPEIRDFTFRAELPDGALKTDFVRTTGE